MNTEGESRRKRGAEPSQGEPLLSAGSKTKPGLDPAQKKLGRCLSTARVGNIVRAEPARYCSSLRAEVGAAFA